jgi:hypothetical protein
VNYYTRPLNLILKIRKQQQLCPEARRTAHGVHSWRGSLAVRSCRTGSRPGHARGSGERSSWEVAWPDPVAVPKSSPLPQPPLPWGLAGHGIRELTPTTAPTAPRGNGRHSPRHGNGPRILLIFNFFSVCPRILKTSNERPKRELPSVTPRTLTQPRGPTTSPSDKAGDFRGFSSKPKARSVTVPA